MTQNTIPKKSKNGTGGSLKRVITLPSLVFYGVGAILGAGVYVLIGKVVGYAGIYAPIAFLLSAVLAGLTGLSYSELASRIPKNAGEVAYVSRAFNQKNISQIVGFIVIFTGIFSAATLSKGFFGYFQLFVPLPEVVVVVCLVLILGAFACWGMKESMIAVTLITLIEVGGLIMVIALLGDNFAKLPEIYSAQPPGGGFSILSGILLGGFLAFYAFIGFEDMVNVAEEVVQPEKTIPKAIILSVVISTLLYIAVAFVAISSMPVDQIAGSRAPLADILSQKGAFYPRVVSLISLIAVINGALIQIIMASRVLYGMSSQKIIHPALAAIHPKTGTPLKATVLVAGIVLFFALLIPLTSLGELTSFVIILLFAIINLALIKIKKQAPETEHFKVHISVPIASIFLSIAFLAIKIYLL